MCCLRQKQHKRAISDSATHKVIDKLDNYDMIIRVMILIIKVAQKILGD